ncbi:MAG: UBP-type zinc finger domain-containing protein [Acidobacteria bacterium]|nr:UBP-type zinc finger domain-containing protein [Acidobacteriota bacterium]
MAPPVLPRSRLPPVADSSHEGRLCVTCGHLGCSESQLTHGTKHWLESGHPNTPMNPDGFTQKRCTSLL